MACKGCLRPDQRSNTLQSRRLNETPWRFLQVHQWTQKSQWPGQWSQTISSHTSKICHCSVKTNLLEQSPSNWNELFSTDLRSLATTLRTIWNISFSWLNNTGAATLIEACPTQSHLFILNQTQFVCRDIDLGEFTSSEYLALQLRSVLITRSSVLQELPQLISLGTTRYD